MNDIRIIRIEYEIINPKPRLTKQWGWQELSVTEPDAFLKLNRSQIPGLEKPELKVQTWEPYSFCDFLKSAAYIAAQFPYENIDATYEGETSTVCIGARLQDSVFFGEWERAFAKPNERLARWLREKPAGMSKTRRDAISELQKRLGPELALFRQTPILK